jgi:hypothetical protein
MLWIVLLIVVVVAALLVAVTVPSLLRYLRLRRM